MGNLIASCCGTAGNWTDNDLQNSYKNNNLIPSEYDTATAKSHNSNLSLSSSSIGSEKVLDQEPPSLPPSLPPRIQERKESSSSSSSSSSESEEEDGDDKDTAGEANNEVESSLIVGNDQCVKERDNTDHSDNNREQESDTEEVGTVETENHED